MALPSIPDAFRWTHESWGSALRCRPLEAVAPHLFTTRQLQLPDPDAWRALAAAMGVGSDRVLSPRQVHGNAVIVVRKASPAAVGALAEADAIVTDDPSLAVVVRAADCVPLLLADRRTGAVGAVHAGWRGTAASVAAAAVRALQREFGSRPEDLVAALGPSIGSCCYEVGTELVDAFAAAGHERSLIDRWFLAPPPRRGRFRPALSPGEGPGLRLDVPGANRDQLILAGVADENIHLAGVCTAMNLEVMTSYRAEKEGAGRIAGVIKAGSGSQRRDRHAEPASGT